MIEALLVAAVFGGGLMLRYSRWLWPKRRNEAVRDEAESFDLRRPRDLITVVLLVVGTAAGVVLVAATLVLRAR